MDAAAKPVDAAWLAAFRIVFGLTLAVSMERFLAYGWVEQLLTAPHFRFHYWPLPPIEPLPGPWLRALFVALVVLSLAVAAGLWFRFAAISLWCGLVYVQTIDVSTYLNHYYLAALLLGALAVSPAGRSYSLDAWWRARRAPPREPWIPSAWLWLFRMQVGVVYFFAGLAKLQGDWLLHAMPLRIWLGASTELPVLGRLLTLDGVPLLFAWCGFLFDLTIVGWLSWPKSRPWAYAVVLVFHAITRLLFDIGMFPWIMSGAALVFFSPSWPRWLLGRLGLPSRPSPLQRAARPSRTSHFGVALLLGYALLQVALPLRHLAYGGNVLWHEQGMRFSWRVMVRAKGGTVEFHVRDPASGRTWRVSPRRYLNPFQENEMVGQPDLILQLAHHVARDFQHQGIEGVEVRADSRASLNGRRLHPFVDPTIDLAGVHDGLGRHFWVLPAPNEPPPHLRPVL